MTSDFRLLSREEAGDPGIVREAILSGQVVVVGGEDGRIRGVIDERSRLEAGDYIVVDPGQAFDAALRAINEAGARLALVARNDAGGDRVVLGVITEHAIAELAYAAVEGRFALSKRCAEETSVSANLSSSAAPTQPVPSRWGPFSHVAFTVIWTASVISNVGTAMFDTASGWLITSLDANPIIVSLVQVAVSLPLFLFTLPAGALADVIDSRRLLIAVELAILAVSVIFAALCRWTSPRRRFCWRRPSCSAWAER